jgi:acetyl/propionyl-CoA carboxylase alpha subunit
LIKLFNTKLYRFTIRDFFQEAVEFCEKHGVPVMFKAAFGGGGRGMRAVFKMEDVAEQFERARLD